MSKRKTEKWEISGGQGEDKFRFVKLPARGQRSSSTSHDICSCLPIFVFIDDAV